MTQVNLYAAKTNLSALVDAAAAGEEVVIAKAGKPMARLVAIAVEPARERPFGLYRGRVRVSADFDAPLPADLVAAFEGTGDGDMS